MINSQAYLLHSVQSWWRNKKKDIKKSVNKEMEERNLIRKLRLSQFLMYGRKIVSAVAKTDFSNNMK